MVRWKDYSVTVEGEEEENGYVFLHEGKAYAVQLTNHSTTRRCAAVLCLDGKEQGCFVLEAGQKIKVERPIQATQPFIFVKHGELSVHFFPEKQGATCLTFTHSFYSRSALDPLQAVTLHMHLASRQG